VSSPWRVAIVSSILLGLTVGLPYYAIPFFYDYWETNYGWSRGAIMLGLPLGTLVTLALGPLFVRRLSPRHSITGGSVLVAASLAGFGLMPPNILAYYALWVLYMAGWTFAGPLAHQILLTQLFPEKRGSALAVAYFGISFLGAISVAAMARPLTLAYGFETALLLLGALIALAVPLSHWGLPATGADHNPKATPVSVPRNRPFWLLLAGTTISIAGVGGISQHLKLILREANYPSQAHLDGVFGLTVLIMLLTGSGGRFLFAWSADRFPKRPVLTAAFGLMAGSMPLLLVFDWAPDRLPYLFALIFGLGMSVDSLMLPLLAAEHFGSRSLPPVLGIIVPVNVVGQTWFPSLLTLLWSATGSYTVPLWFTFGVILTGRFLLAAMPPPAAGHHPAAEATPAPASR
jgi:MFS family permease